VPAPALFDPDPEHPWNRLHARLFTAKTTAPVAECLASHTPCTRIESTAQARFLTRTFVQGGDGSPLLLRGEPRFLADRQRRQALQEAIAAALRVSPEAARARPVAAALLQNDLWVRFDTIDHWLRRTPAQSIFSAEEMRWLKRLREGVGKVIRALALPAASLAAIRSNLPDAVAAHRALLPDLDTERGWVEVGAQREDEHLDPTWRANTRHAQVAGFTNVYRVLVRVPEEAGGSGWLRGRLAGRPNSVSLPAGSRTLILQQPLALSEEGRVVPLPLVTLVETMRTLASSTPLTSIADLPFDVLEAGRTALATQAPPKDGGLRRLAPDDPAPFGGAAADFLQTRRLPMRNACLVCHDPRGQEMRDPMDTEPARFHEIAERGRQARAVIEAKEQRADYAELRRFFTPSLKRP
jgi:hypothetical protein